MAYALSAFIFGMAQHILCEYRQGEERGIWLLRQLKEFAPDQETAEIIAGQIIDEEKHTRLFAGRLKDLGIDCETMMQALTDIYDLAQSCVDRKDWVQSIAVQAIIEELAMTTFTNQLPKTDEATQEVLREVIDDERRHLEFGMSELKKFRAGNEDRIRELHLKALNIFVGAFKEGRLQRSLQSTAQKAYRTHHRRLKTLGVEVPGVSELMVPTPAQS